METVRWFDRITLADDDLVGGKGANLGEFECRRAPGPAGVRRDLGCLPLRARERRVESSWVPWCRG